MSISIPCLLFHRLNPSLKKKKAGWDTTDRCSVLSSLTLKVPGGGLSYRGSDRKKLGPEPLIHIFWTILSLIFTACSNLQLMVGDLKAWKRITHL